MKKEFIILVLLFISTISFSQENKYKTYSYTEFFKLIENEKDTIFKLSDAYIKYNPKTDERFRTEASPEQTKDINFVYKNDLVITKHLELNNVQFEGNNERIGDKFYAEGVLYDIHFKKSVQFTDIKSLNIQYCRFDQKVDYLLTNCEAGDRLISGNNGVSLQFSEFATFVFNSLCENSIKTSYYIIGNTFRPSYGGQPFILYLRGSDFFVFERNTITNVDLIFFGLLENSGRIRLRENVFDSDFIHIAKTNFDGQLRWTNNTYSTPVFIELDPFSTGDEIDWNQFNQGFTAYNSFVEYTLEEANRYPIRLSAKDRKILSKQYMDSIRIFNEDAFSEEMSIKSQFYNHYKSRYNTQKANKVYLNLKDFETKRLKVIHDQNPGFRSYFKWKVNQFLKVFSDYGTEPSKAIVVSLYVILFFALIYLLFPNSWDSHGKHRVMNRYRFFTKYMNKEAGMHDVYLEEQQEELLVSEDFKAYMQKAEKHIPKFFIATAILLYKWSVSGTKLSAALLKRVDIMKGTWQDLPAHQRFWKSILLITAFIVAVIYDICIKMLNALMLSINTFTTLGFGEIPIKGLPRYLAIIQGFIGWFMLTIFSVSLISQLLN